MTDHLLVSGTSVDGQLQAALGESTGLDPEAIGTLARAMLKDAVHGVEESGGGLVVAHAGDDESGSGARPVELAELVGEVTEEFETTPAEATGVAGPAAIAERGVASLLEREEATSVAVLDGLAPTIDRSALDSAAMKLRRSEVVLAPAPCGRIAYLGLAEPLELGELPWPLPLNAVVEQAVEAGYEVDFLPHHPWVGSREDLLTLVSVITARRAAGRRVPPYTATAISDLGLSVVDDGDGPRLESGSTDRD